MLADTVRSRCLDLGGPVHVAELGGDGHPVVCVHGLGGSYANWVAAAPLLGAVGRVSALDLPGFGLSPPGAAGAGLEANRGVLDRYLRSLAQPVTLIGNSMGGTVALRQAARAPETVARLILVSPAAPWPFRRYPPDPLVSALFLAYVVPGVAPLVQLLRRKGMPPETVARLVLEMCSSRPERITPEVVDLHVRVAEERRDIGGIDRAFTQATRSVVFSALRRTVFDRDLAAVTAPTLVVHGEDDRLVSVAASRRISVMRPDWRVEIVPEVGHIAMVEVPALFGRLVEDFIAHTSKP